MTIASTATSQQYVRNGSTTQWSYPNKVFSAADLVVSDLDTSVPPIATLLVLNTDYTVSNVDVDAGALVTTTLPGVAGHTLDIRSNISPTQLTSIKNQGSYLPELHEEFFDRITREVQDLRRLTYLYGIHGPDNEVAQWPALPPASTRRNTALMFDAITGLPSIGIPTTQTLTLGLIAPLLGLTQTTQEQSAGVVPTALQFYPGDVRRYGAVGDGVTDDTVPLQNAVKTGHRVLGGGPQYTYLYTTNILVPVTVTTILADWQGATLRPSGLSAPLIANANPAVAASTTLTAAPTLGTVSFSVTSATGLAVGQICWISAANYPSYFGRIRSLAGTAVVFDTAAPVTYVVAPTITAYAPNTFYQKIDWQNYRFDGTALTAANATLGQCMRWVGAKVCHLSNGEYCNFSLPSAASTVVLAEVFFCAQVDITSQWFHDNPLQVSALSNSGVALEVDDCGQVNVSGNLIEGDGFGINITRAAQARASGNVLRGQRFWETATSSVLASVRGIKISACAVAKWMDNTIEDYVTPVKGDQGFQAIIVGNVLRNSPGTGTTGTIFSDGAIEIAPAAGSTISHGILIQGNVIENTNGHGILLSDNNGSATALLQAHIIGNRIKGTKGFSINFIGKQVLIAGNHLEDWDLGIAGTAAIGNSGGGLGNGVTVRDNWYTHNSDNTRPLCQGSGANVGAVNLIDGNISPTGNPLLGTSANGFVTSGTATIASGTTSIGVTFPAALFRAPTADEITITPTALTTANPGLYWASALTNTGFTFNCFTNPGAGGFPVSYQAKIKQPYTV